MWHDNVPWGDPVDVSPPVYYETTTRELVSQHVIPLTSAMRAPLYARVPPSERGAPGVFLSHSWANLVVGATRRTRQAGTLESYSPERIAGIRDEFIWMDIVCYNQHAVPEESIAFDMEGVVRSIKKVAFAVTQTTLFDRIWCLWELLAADRTGAEIQLCAAPTYRTDKRMTVNTFVSDFTSVADAKSTKPGDYKKCWMR